MAVSKDSPKRRKSIAVTNQNRPAVLPRAKRRPHSIVPGDRLSPFAKARRSLAPRKSILKTFTNTLRNDNDSPQNSQTESSSSQPTYLPSSLDDTTMDFTRDYQTKLQDNPSRKSFGGRRVSFAENVNVRFIENLKKDKNAVDSDANNKPGTSTSHSDKETSQPPTNENDYPGASSSSRRRSSARRSLGEDMDITTIGPRVVFSADDSAIADEEFDFPDDDDDDGMELTDVVRGANVHRRVSSLGRAPLTQLAVDAPPSDDLEHSQSFDEPASSDDSNRSEPMDFTMPLSRSKRAPVEQDELWHALRQATHSGDTPIEPEVSSDDLDLQDTPYEDDGMDLDDAVQRLMRARVSLPSVLAMHTPENAELHANESFSTEDSFEEQRDQTMNFTAVYGRESLGGDHSRQSTGSAMDESEVYGSVAVPLQPTPKPFLVHREEVDVPSPSLKEPSPIVFRPPPSAPFASADASQESSHQQVAASVFIPPKSPSKSKASTNAPASPTKAKQPPARTGFTAAFAPPVARPSPNKRPRPTDENVQHHDIGKPSPAKRVSLAGRGPAEPTTASLPTPQPRPVSPSKTDPVETPATSTTSRRQSLSIRRPSGYFAKRKSLGDALASQPQEEDVPPTQASPKMKAIGLRRPSLGSASASAWECPEQDRYKENVNHDEDASRPVVTSSATARDSSAPASSRPIPMPVSIEVTAASPRLPVVDVSTVFSPDDQEEEEPEDIDMDEDATEQWRNAVESNRSIEADYPPMSIKEFFATTGIKFMDELTAPRRSTHPSQQILPQPREPEEIPLADYAVAMGMDLPQLALYSRVSKDLETWIEKSKADFEQAEDEAAKITPELFTEYSKADEEGQAELLHQLQLIRTNTRALAKSDWYDWKLQWLEGLRVTAAQTFQSLESDAKTLETIRASVGDLIPSLQEEYEEIMKELERESAEVVEIEACDQDYLNELKASIAEQNIEVEALKAEVAESKAKLHSLQERLGVINAEKYETKAVIDDAQTALRLQKNSTRAEVFKLKDELESLENLHMLRITKVNSEMFEYIYASQFRISIPCRNYVPMHTRVDVTRLDKMRTKNKDNFPRLSDFLLHMAKDEIVQGEARTTRQIMHRLSDYWSSCAQLRTQLKLLLIKFPVEIEMVKTSGPEPDAFKVRVMVIFPSVKAKAFISFVFAGKAFSYWPLAINSLQCEVEVAYGRVDPDVIAKAVVDRLSQSTAEDNYACLLDACIEAQEIYY